jgi:hypothetical protein
MCSHSVEISAIVCPMMSAFRSRAFLDDRETIFRGREVLEKSNWPRQWGDQTMGFAMIALILNSTYRHFLGFRFGAGIAGA